MTEQPISEPIANIGIKRERGYLYYINKEGNVCRIKKTGPRKRYKKKKTPFKFFNAKVPRVLLDCYVSTEFKKVSKDSNCGKIFVPKEMIDKTFKVILIPEEYYNLENEKQNKEKTE
ncbi:MAG: hypothetical protein ACFFG0_02975 [Candidatus Thorarchaeota archaeon]